MADAGVEFPTDEAAEPEDDLNPRIDQREFYLSGNTAFDDRQRRELRVRNLIMDVPEALNWVPLGDLTEGGFAGLEMFLADLRLALAYVAELEPSRVQNFPASAFGHQRPATKTDFAEQSRSQSEA